MRCRTLSELCLFQDQNAVYPAELNAFVDKRMLFKVEVSDANLFRNWHSYTVKKMSSDDEIINRFLILHGLKVVTQVCLHSLVLILFSLFAMVIVNRVIEIYKAE